MSWQFITNQTPATGSVAVFNIMTSMTNAGWVVKSSSDGTTYNSSGNQITSGNSGANGLANNDAWFRIQDPAGLREFTVQRGTSNTVWRVKYSKSAKFTTGSPSATQTPQSSDQETVIGGGTDSSPSFTAWFGGSDGSYRFSCAAQNTPVPVVINSITYNVYPFFAFAFPTGGGTCNMGFAIDVLSQTLNTAFNSNEQDPLVIFNGVGSGTPFTSSWSSANNFMGWVYAASTTWASSLTTDAPTGLITTGNVMGTDPNNGNDLGGRPVFYYPSGGPWPKGWGQTLKLHITGTSGQPRPTPATLTYSTPSDTILIGNTELPWDGSTPIV